MHFRTQRRSLRRRELLLPGFLTLVAPGRDYGQNSRSRSTSCRLDGGGEHVFSRAVEWRRDCGLQVRLSSSFSCAYRNETPPPLSPHRCITTGAKLVLKSPGARLDGSKLLPYVCAPSLVPTPRLPPLELVLPSCGASNSSILK